jgi:hypothetical protein
LNEFDSYVRHTIKPLAYVRYGDDFVLFCPNEASAVLAKDLSIQRLTRMGLTINAGQNQTIRSWQGLHFLGHTIGESGAKITKKTQALMMKRLSLQNISSYSSLNLSEETKRLLPWLIEL